MEDLHFGPDFPTDYQGLLALYKTACIANRRLVGMVGNLSFAVNSFVEAYQDEDALLLHRRFDQFIAGQQAADAMEKARESAGINTTFPTVQ